MLGGDPPGHTRDIRGKGRGTMLSGWAFIQKAIAVAFWPLCLRYRADKRGLAAEIQAECLM